MKPEIQLSIIIPVYNVEQYIERCLDSIYNQASNEMQFEIITVNDGSPDNSLYILKKYQQHHNNFFIINSDNQGAGSARNKGLERAQGKFIWFIDGDDFIEPNAFAFIYKNAILKEQQIGFNYNKHSNRDGKVPARTMLDNEKYSKSFKGLDYTLGNRSFFLWLSIIRKENLDKNNIRFTEGIKNIEDFEFMMKFFSLDKMMVFYNERLYNYNNENEISTSRDKSKENLKILAENSVIVHTNLQALTTRNEMLQFWLTKSIIGFFISLLKYYPKSDYLNYIRMYKDKGLIPLHLQNKLPLKYKVFGIFLNHSPKILYKFKIWL